MKLLRYIFVILPLALATVVYAGEWDASAGFGGTYLNSGGNNAETFYWGPFASVGNQLTENLHVRADLRHSRDRLFYDGLGGIARQSWTAIGPGVNWDFAEGWNLDGDYKFRIGENNFREHEFAAALEYAALSKVRFAGDIVYGTRGYTFPRTGTDISAQSASYTLEVVPRPVDWLEFPVSGNIASSSYNTNKSAYTVYMLSLGASVFLADRQWKIGAAITPGKDSSNYSIIGGDLRIRYRATDNIALRFVASVTSYSFSQTQTAKSKRSSGTAVNPLGNSDSFNITAVGLEASYSY
ncbi:MAG: hypothetical protein U1F40_04905 [Turneriella sp.]